jgi:hypothetical protein
MRKILAPVLLAAAMPGTAAVLSFDAPPTPVQLAAGQTVRHELAMPEARRVRVVIRDLSTQPASAAGVALRVRKADGTSAGADWTQCNADRARSDCAAEITAEAGGKYLIDLDAPFSASMRFTIAVVGLPEWPAAGAAGNAPLVLREEQRFQVDVKAGEWPTFGLAEIIQDPPDARFGPWLALIDARGGRLADMACRPGPYSLCKLSPGELRPGAYTVLVRPHKGSTLSARPHRSRDQVVKATGDMTEIRITEPGQVVRIAIPTEQGQPLAVTLSDIRREPAGVAQLRLALPNGGSASSSVAPNATSAAIGPLPVATSGTALVTVDPGFSTLSATLGVKR